MGSHFLFCFFQRVIDSSSTSVASSASAPAAAIPTSASAPASTAITTTAAAALLAGSGDIHGQISTLKFLPVKHLNGFLCFLVGTHFDKAKSPAFAGELILHHG